MATKLDDYFANQYPYDRRDLRDVQLAIQECVDLYTTVGEVGSYGGPNYSWLSEASGWFYEISFDKDGKLNPPSGKPSPSTTGMIGAALQRLIVSGSGLRASEGYRERPYFSSTKFAETEKIKKLREISISSLAKICSINPASEYLTNSTSYGPDDPASLGWCWDLSKERHKDHPLRVAVIRAAVKKAGHFLSPESGKNGNILIAPSDARPGASAFMALRFARLIESLRTDLAEDDFKKFDPENHLEAARTKVARFFETGLHRHLSFAEIPDSRFDAAELIFCLEGILLCEKWQVDDRIFLRVIELLKRSQEANAFWRSETPIVAKITGHVLLPVSVEAAKSLLAAVSIYDGDKKLHAPIAAACIEMLRRFWRWLVSRKVEINLNGKVVFGWHSEHVNDKTIIHLWETSQVLEFLVSFKHLLRLHIARTTLEFSGVKHAWPSDDKRKKSSVKDLWEDISKKWEPNASMPERLRVYRAIERDFVLGRSTGEGAFEPFGNSSWSMLLYGPPGTGKSSIAENLATVFDCRYISLSVSDFMETGPGQMEARAKQIFEMLEAQPFSVVIFDEFDPFMYDRDSKRFGDLSAEFQLMTNGMLPKLQSLRKSKSVVFVFATNYIDRIDAALRRVGRFDWAYMVPPMDRNARARTVTKLIFSRFEQWCRSSLPDFAELLKDKEIEGQLAKARAAIFDIVFNHKGLSASGAGFGHGDLELAFERGVSWVGGNLIKTEKSPAETTIFEISTEPEDGRRSVDEAQSIFTELTDKRIVILEKAALGVICDSIARVLRQELTPAVSLEQYDKRLFPAVSKEVDATENKKRGGGKTSAASDKDYRRLEQSVVAEYLGLAAVYWEVEDGKTSSAFQNSAIQRIHSSLAKAVGKDIEESTSQAAKAIKAYLDVSDLSSFDGKEVRTYQGLVNCRNAVMELFKHKKSSVRTGVRGKGSTK